MNQAICWIRAHASQEHLYIRVLGEVLRDRTTKIFFHNRTARPSFTNSILRSLIQAATSLAKSEDRSLRLGRSSSLMSSLVKSLAAFCSLVPNMRFPESLNEMQGSQS